MSTSPQFNSLPLSPKTPIKQKIASEVQSTPYGVLSTATAAASGVPKGANREAAMPNLISDLQSTQDVCFDKFLEACLKDVALPSEVSTPSKELLAKVLEQATELCNVAPTGRADDARTRIAESLQEYCVDAKTELELYGPFVKLSNAVLELAKGQFKNLLQDPDPSSILFHVNHPQNVTSIINGESTLRRPDIVIIPEASARAAFIPIPTPAPSREDVLRRAAATTVLKDGSNKRKQFFVKDIFCNMEFKMTPKPMTSPPPSSWVLNKDPAFSPPKRINEDYLLKAMQDADKKWEPAVPVSSPNNSNDPSTGATGDGDSGTASGSKRKADTTDSEAGPNKRRSSPPKYPATVQSASYALESINRAAGVTKVINMIVENQTLWMWFYDRQGAIQSHGLDFIQDFPRFVTLLAALQRFDRGNWGFHHELEPEAHPTHLLPASASPTIIRFPAPESDLNRNEFVVALSGTILHERATLLGRATRVEQVTVTRGGIPVPGDWVLKVSWPESTRLSEVDILNEAEQLGTTEDSVREHIPELLCSKDLECTTAVIRKALGICDESDEERKGKGQPRGGSRTLRLLVFKKLDRIDTLKSDELLKAFADIVDCHYTLWKNGIKHCDVSPGNLMWNPSEKQGVLNDYDLSRMDSVSQSSNLERTGTIPFLCLDLLRNSAKFRQGLIEPTYNHDCDSLKWAFLYICSVEPYSEVCMWLTADMQKSLAFRTEYLFPRLNRRMTSSKHTVLAQYSTNVYLLLFKADRAISGHTEAVLEGRRQGEYIGPTDSELHHALKSSVRRPIGGVGATG